MADVDEVRLEKVRQAMLEQELEALICRLPEHVVYLTSYWPHHGFSFVVMPSQGKPLLFLPEIEEEYADEDWAEVEVFGWGLNKDPVLYDSYRDILSKVRDRLGLGGAKIGVERGVEITAPTYRVSEPVVPAEPWWNLLDDLFPEAELVGVGGLMQEARGRKTKYELDKLKIANEIAEMGMRSFLEEVEPGMTEVEISALLEGTIKREGPGYKGAKLVRASAEVGAGPIGSAKGTLLVPSSTREIQEGDLVMVELATTVDGYFSDLTYNAVAGEPNDRQKEVYNAVLEAQRAAADQMRPGAQWQDPDRAAREVLDEAGLLEHFPHITGHAVGYRYHEFIPVLTEGMEDALEEGMVSSVEPGVYIEGFGGIRIEDNVAVGPDGPEFLSTPREPW